MSEPLTVLLITAVVAGHYSANVKAPIQALPGETLQQACERIIPQEIPVRYRDEDGVWYWVGVPVLCIDARKHTLSLKTRLP